MTQPYHFPTASIRAFDARIYDGHLDVRTTTNTEGSVTVRQNGNDTCSARVDATDGTLTFVVTKNSLNPFARCDDTYVVEIPAGIPVTITQKKGWQQLQGRFGDVVLKTDENNIRMQGSARTMTIEGDAINVDLEYTDVPSAGSISVEAISTNVNITLPAGSSVATSFPTWMTTVVNDFVVNAASAFRISVDANFSNITVKKAQ